MHKKLVRLSSFTASERANEELQNAFLDDSQAQKEAEIEIFKEMTIFDILEQNVARSTAFWAKITKIVISLKGSISASFRA